MASNGKILDDRAMDVLFREARTHRSWQDKYVSDVLIRSVYDLMKWGPTAANCCPARFIFIKSQEAKERLKPHLDGGNVDKTMKAPLTAIIAYDLKFYEHLDRLYPGENARSWYEGKPAAIEQTAFRSSSLQGAYLMLAARSLGLDCGPMSGFSREGVRKEFFEGTDWQPNFLCNIGYGDDSQLRARLPRLSFDETCRVL